MLQINVSVCCVVLSFCHCYFFVVCLASYPCGYHLSKSVSSVYELCSTYTHINRRQVYTVQHSNIQNHLHERQNIVRFNANVYNFTCDLLQEHNAREKTALLYLTLTKTARQAVDSMTMVFAVRFVELCA